MATLSPRQTISFNHVGDLYEPSRSFDADGKPGVEQYTLAETDVPYRREATANLSEVFALGRLQTTSLMTIESLHFAEDQVVGDAWILVDRSLRPDGSRGSFWGRAWMIRSQPEQWIESPTRQGGKLIVKASEQKELPLGVPV